MALTDFQFSYNGLTLGDGTVYDVTAVRGLVGPGQARISDVLRPLDHGAFVNGGDFAPIRHVELDVQVEGTSDAAFSSAVDALMQAFSPQQSELPFVFQLPGQGANRSLNCRPREATVSVDTSYKFRFPIVTLVLEATDPRVYAANQSSLTLTPGAVSGGLSFGAQRNQLSIDGSDFEASVGLWGSTGNCAVAQTTAQAQQGTHSMSLTSTASGSMFAEYGGNGSAFGAIPVVAGSTYTAVASFRTAVSARACSVTIRWYNASKVNLNADSAGSTVNDTTSGWTQATVTAAAPAGAVYADMYVTVAATGAGSEVHYVDEAGFYPGSSTAWNDANTIVTPSLAFPLSFGAVASSNTGQAVNSGAFETRPVITLTGPITTPKIVNLTTGAFTLLNYTVAAGQTVTIDYLARTIVAANGSSLYYTLDPTSTWWNLPPGTTTLQLAVVAGTGSAVVAWSSAWI